MRNAFADEVTRLASSDSRIVLLSADIGNRLFDKYKAAQPERFYNTGIAEANTISMAAGLASCGLIPVCYTIAPFITARCYEQIKLDICYHNQPVVIVGTGAGLSYASLGTTHHSLEDIALMRTLPGMRVLAPADSMELRACLRTALSENGPTYIRIGKKGEPSIFSTQPSFAFGVWNTVRQGSRITLFSTGNMLPAALEAADLLTETGFSPRVCNCASIKPLDDAALSHCFTSDELVVTIEEHSRIGGFGSAVAEWLADTPAPLKARLLRLGSDDSFLLSHGEQAHARTTFGLSPSAMAKAIASKIAQSSSSTNKS